MNDEKMGGNDNGNVLTMTQDELNKLLQQEGDKRVSQALKTQEAKMREAQKLEMMNEQEKYAYELTQREKAIAEKEKALTLAENKASGLAVLADKGLPTSLIDFVVSDTADEMNTKITALENAWADAVKAEVEKRISTNGAPKAPESAGGITREDFMKMGLAERQNLYNTNPELYKSLTI